MPFTIRQFRRLPACCAVTYHRGDAEGSGTVRNLSFFCVLALSLITAVDGCAPMQFENAGSPNTLAQDKYDCELLLRYQGGAYAFQPIDLVRGRSETQACLERKGWRRTNGEGQVKKPDAVTGTNQRTGQNQSRAQETPLAGIQGKEGQFYERQIEGDNLSAKLSEKQKQDKPRTDPQKSILDSIYEDILQRGHDITVGEPEANARKEMADLSFPVVIKSDPIVGANINELNRSGFGKELSNKTYRTFEQRLDNLYFILQLVVPGGELFACHAPRSLSKYETDGEFLSVDDKPSAWNIKISVPLQALKRVTSVRGRFVEGASGSVCEVAKNSK